MRDKRARTGQWTVPYPDYAAPIMRNAAAGRELAMARQFGELRYDWHSVRSQATMLGFEAARQAVELGRRAFFPEHAHDLPARRSVLLQGDDLAPQFGYIGDKISVGAHRTDPGDFSAGEPGLEGDGTCRRVRADGVMKAHDLLLQHHAGDGERAMTAGSFDCPTRLPAFVPLAVDSTISTGSSEPKTPCVPT